MGLWKSHFLNQIFVADHCHEAHLSHQTSSHLYKGFIQLQVLGQLGRGGREEQAHRLGMSERILPPCLTFFGVQRATSSRHQQIPLFFQALTHLSLYLLSVCLFHSTFLMNNSPFHYTILENVATIKPRSWGEKNMEIENLMLFETVSLPFTHTSGLP